MVCHGELVKRKRHPSFYRSFTLRLQREGTRSIFVVLIAPRIFNDSGNSNSGLLLCAAFSCYRCSARQESWFYKRPEPSHFALCGDRGLHFSRSLLRQGLVAMNGGGQVAFRARNFFGVKTGIQDQAGNWLTHGRIRHGVQLRDPAMHDEPTLTTNGSVAWADSGSLSAALDRRGKRPGLRVGVEASVRAR